MVRDWGVTARLVESRPTVAAPLFEVLSLPGDLLVVVGLVGAVGITDVARHMRSEEPGAPLCSDRMASFVAVVFGGLAAIVAIEALVGLSRPPSGWHAIEPSPYGFPSGHTMAATVAWGAVAWWYPRSVARVWRTLGVGLLVALVGLSRLFLGVHYVADVGAAIILGAGYLAIGARFVGTDPRRGFAMAVGLGLLAIAATGASERALLAFAGTAGSAIGWILIQPAGVRRRVRTVSRGIT